MYGSVLASFIFFWFSSASNCDNNHSARGFGVMVTATNPLNVKILIRLFRDQFS